MIDSHQFVQWVGGVIVILLAWFLLATPTPTAEVQLHTVRQENKAMLGTLSAAEKLAIELQDSLNKYEVQLGESNARSKLASEQLDNANQRIANLQDDAKAVGFTKEQERNAAYYNGVQSVTCPSVSSPSTSNSNPEIYELALQLHEQKQWNNRSQNITVGTNVAGIAEELVPYMTKAAADGSSNVAAMAANCIRAVDNMINLTKTERDSWWRQCESHIDGDCKEYTASFANASNCFADISKAISKLEVRNVLIRTKDDLQTKLEAKKGRDSQNFINNMLFFIRYALDNWKSRLDNVYMTWDEDDALDKLCDNNLIKADQMTRYASYTFWGRKYPTFPANDVANNETLYKLATTYKNLCNKDKQVKTPQDLISKEFSRFRIPLVQLPANVQNRIKDQYDSVRHEVTSLILQSLKDSHEINAAIETGDTNKLMATVDEIAAKEDNGTPVKQYLDTFQQPGIVLNLSN